MSEPTLVPAAPKRRFSLPELRSPWWAGLLIFSLMANLVVAGAAIGMRFHGGHGQGSLFEVGAQLLPRKFFGDLPRERRREFMDILRAKNDQFAQNRNASDATTLKFADVLEQSDFDQAKVKAIVEEIATGPTSFTAQGEALVLEVVAKLTPDERKSLASAIRNRVAHHERN